MALAYERDNKPDKIPAYIDREALGSVCKVHMIVFKSLKCRNFRQKHINPPFLTVKKFHLNFKDNSYIHDTYFASKKCNKIFER